MKNLFHVLFLLAPISLYSQIEATKNSVAKSVPGVVAISDVNGRAIDVSLLDYDEKTVTFIKDKQKFSLRVDQLSKESIAKISESFAALKNEFKESLDAFTSSRKKDISDFQGFGFGSSPQEVMAQFFKNYNLKLNLARKGGSDAFYYVGYTSVDGSGQPAWDMLFGFSGEHLVTIQKQYNVDAESARSDLVRYLKVSANDKTYKGVPRLFDGKTEFIFINATSFSGVISSGVTFRKSIYGAAFQNTEQHVVALGLIERGAFYSLATKRLESSYNEMRILLNATDFSSDAKISFGDGTFHFMYSGFEKVVTDPALAPFINGQLNQFIAFLLQRVYVPRDDIVHTVAAREGLPEFNLYISWETKDGFSVLVTNANHIFIGKKQFRSPL